MYILHSALCVHAHVHAYMYNTLQNSDYTSIPAEINYKDKENGNKVFLTTTVILRVMWGGSERIDQRRRLRGLQLHL